MVVAGGRAHAVQAAFPQTQQVVFQLLTLSRLASSTLSTWRPSSQPMPRLISAAHLWPDAGFAYAFVAGFEDELEHHQRFTQKPQQRLLRRQRQDPRLPLHRETGLACCRTLSWLEPDAKTLVWTVPRGGARENAPAYRPG
jgi:hypothetical protein